MSWETVPLGDVVELCYGRALKAESRSGSGYPVVGSGGIVGQHRSALVSGPTVVVGRKGSIGSLTFVPDGCWPIDTAYYTRLKRDADVRWLYWTMHSLGLNSMNKSAAVPGLNREDAYRCPVPLPPLPEQRRIAAILDEADAVGKSVGRRIDLLPALLARAYDKLFGDPRCNPREWPIRQLGEVALKVSDGPFGSNLKSAHYTNSGVRVVRLQNIGVDEFLGADAAYVSEDHFERLRRHELLEGDVVVGTLGDPILRACVVPEGLGRAINKADCVQIRPDESLATGLYLSATLNHRSMVKSAQSLAHGQTRSRISMSQVRALGVPVPPLGLQREFGELRSRYSAELAAMYSARRELDELFASLQHRAFRGEL